MSQTKWVNHNHIMGIAKKLLNIPYFKKLLYLYNAVQLHKQSIVNSYKREM